MVVERHFHNLIRPIIRIITNNTRNHPSLRTKEKLIQSNVHKFHSYPSPVGLYFKYFLFTELQEQSMDLLLFQLRETLIHINDAVTDQDILLIYQQLGEIFSHYWQTYELSHDCQTQIQSWPAQGKLYGNMFIES